MHRAVALFFVGLGGVKCFQLPSRTSPRTPSSLPPASRRPSLLAIRRHANSATASVPSTNTKAVAAKQDESAVRYSADKGGSNEEKGGDDDDDDGYPRPLTGPEMAGRALTFWQYVLPMLAGYLALILELEARTALNLPPMLAEEEAARWEVCHEAGSIALAAACNDLQGFYAKTGQIIATRSDLFPPQYTDRLASLTDSCEQLPFEIVEQVVRRELCGGASLDNIFESFDREPLGSATVAQVHRAVLKADGRVVAVKVQRPNVEPKLLGDVANLKALALQVRRVGSKWLPVDYYTVFSELEAQLANEFDFEAEAEAMDRIGATLHRTTDRPLVTPRAVPGLVTKRVLAMDYLAGVPLSRSLQLMQAQGIDPSGPEAQIFGRRLVRDLTEAFGACILLDGFFHGDPHPGNIMVLDDGRIGLIDFGQVKAIDYEPRRTLARIMLALSGYNDLDVDPRLGEGGGAKGRFSGAATSGTTSGRRSVWRRLFASRPCKEKQLHEDNAASAAGCVAVMPENSLASLGGRSSSNGIVDLNVLTGLAEELGVVLKEGAAAEGAAATAMWLFDGSVKELPGGYSTNELSPDSPLKELSSFPQALTMIGRNTILIKGVASRLGLSHSLAKEWVPIAARLLFDAPPDTAATQAANAAYFASSGSSGGGSSGGGDFSSSAGNMFQPQGGQRKLGKRARVAAWLNQKSTALAMRSKWLPAPVRRRAAATMLWFAERGDKK